MKRQDELNEAWCKYMGKCSTEIMQALAFALRWTDAHPHWISVEDEMPPMSDEDGMSDKVLTHSKGGGIYFNRYDYGHNTWGNPLAFNVTHWMPMPQPPESGNNSKEGGEK